MPSDESSIVWNGSFFASTVVPETVASAAARRSWSKARTRVFFTGSTSMNSPPSPVELRYVKRSSGSHVAFTVPPTTSGFTAAARNRSARA